MDYFPYWCFFFITSSFSVSRKKFNLLLDFIPAAILVFFFFLTGFIQSGLIISSSSFVSLNGLPLSAIASRYWALQVVHPSPLAPHTKIYQYYCTADLNISLRESGFLITQGGGQDIRTGMVAIFENIYASKWTCEYTRLHLC